MKKLTRAERIMKDISILKGCEPRGWPGMGKKTGFVDHKKKNNKKACRRKGDKG